MNRFAAAGLTVLSVLVLVFAVGCKTEETVGKRFRPTYVPKYDEAGENNMAEDVTVKFIGTVMSVKKIGKGNPSGVIVGSKFHAKYTIDIRIDSITQDDISLITEGGVTTFSVGSMSGVFGREPPKKDAPEKDRKYRFTIKGELEERKYEYKYFVGAREL